MRFSPPARIKTFSLVVLVALFAFVGAAFPAATNEVKPFSYFFRVKAVTVTGTFTKDDASTTTRIHLRKPSGPIRMRWLGSGPAGSQSGGASSYLAFDGDATYTSSDPKCNRVLKVDSSGSHPIMLLALGGARDSVTKPTIYVKVQKFPIVTGYPTRPDGTCGKVAKDWWDSASRIYPFALLKQKGFVMVVRYAEKFDDGEAIDWTVRLTVQRISFHRI
ncbi:MAG: hypothetical protein M3R26_00290 [Actinomycetota bacterium]|nr:hypothetical protein [Actinomycetota bacterium]